ncbi:hypothetical protein ABE29_09145 [Cytobacillus firmus]|nr:hypothetical protein [Cytobacillus firmus]MBG9554630.1 hypothetical protein [Cytobacillus firmus]MBG9558292.1 hypothetical protein [Cytobacillus firmus]MBG9574217.1 hypothetical protein [Cytobacillus firmus]SUV04231.1 guanosine 5'-monophosphate oxidoreductase [Cytobacillus firmus]
MILEDGVKAFKENGNTIELASGTELCTHMAILSIGVKPENKLALLAGLDVGQRGGILVNEYLQTEDPDIYEKDGKLYKEYFGSASEFQKGEKKNVEGKRILVEHKGSLADTLKEMEQDLQSSISYAGGNKLDAICHVDYVIVKNSIFNGDRVF